MTNKAIIPAMVPLPGIRSIVPSLEPPSSSPEEDRRCRRRRGSRVVGRIQYCCPREVEEGDEACERIAYQEHVRRPRTSSPLFLNFTQSPSSLEKLYYRELRD